MKHYTIPVSYTHLDVYKRQGYNGWLSLTNNDFFYYTVNNRLDYNKTFGNHGVDLTVFHEFNYQKTNTTASTMKGLKNPLLDVYLNNNYATPLTITGARNVYTLESLAALLDYCLLYTSRCV